MHAIGLAAAIGLIAGLPSCSSTRHVSRQSGATPTKTRQSAATMVTNTQRVPPIAMLAYGTFGLRSGCLVLKLENALKPENAQNWLVAVVPPGSAFTHDSRGEPDGVVVEGKTAKFGERIDFVGGESFYDARDQQRVCAGPAVIVGGIKFGPPSVPVAPPPPPNPTAYNGH